MVVESQSYVKEYLDYFVKYSKIYTNLCILMQVGSFYEIVQVQNEKENIGNAVEIASLLNIQLTKKNKKIDAISRSNPLMCGIPVHTMKKYLPILLSNDFTVLIVDQCSNNSRGSNGSVKRKISYIYSKGAPPIEDIDENDSSNMIMCLVIDFVTVTDICLGITMIDVTTGEVFLTEFYSDKTDPKSTIDYLYTFLQKYRPKELVVITNGNQEKTEMFPNMSSDSSNNILFCETFELNPNTTYINSQSIQKDYFYSTYQNEFLSKLYSFVKADMGLLTPIEYFDLEKMTYSLVSFIVLCNFIHQHNETLLTHLASPKSLNEQEHVVLQSSTCRQLTILPDKEISHRFDSLFSVLNKVSTVIGRRKLKALLVSPLTNSSELEMRYSFSDDLSKIGIQDVEKILNEICDFHRLHRKMALKSLHPYEFVRLHATYANINKLIEYLDTHFSESNQSETYTRVRLSNNRLYQFHVMMEDYQSTFDLKEMEKYNLHESASTIGNYFLSGVKEIDEINEKITNLHQRLHLLSTELSSFITTKREIENGVSNSVKITCNENEGYSLTTTNARCQVIKRELDKKNQLNKYKFKVNKSETRITSDEIDCISNELLKLKLQFNKLLKEKYLEYLSNMYSRNKELFEELLNLIELVDITKANVKCSKLYKYSRPILVNKEVPSYFKATGIRHPIIERLLTDTEYIPNDLELSNDTTGLVLYGLNAGGKSSLLRAVGLCVIMAQCGFYVPCHYFELCPFKTIISQVDLHDNIWKGQSSFVTEMINLRGILKKSDQHTLVLADELCKGSEVTSATAIFASTVDLLAKKNVKFIFTTHLHKVAELEIIKKANNIRIAHLQVEITKDKKIAFCRKLVDGPSQSLYGLEVAKALDLDKSFINKAFEIRNILIGKKAEILSTKKSKYNSKKLVDTCEICGYYKQSKTDMHLHTHHIGGQCFSDQDGFIGHFHKNAKFNLITLCEQCHENVHNNKITINGYKQTTNGVELDFF